MQYDVIVIGGGAVGLASAYKILEKNPFLRLCVLEKENTLAQHQTGNNSGVIHSGIYYKPGSLKAKNCLQGYQLLLDFCDKEGIEYELCGKIIVATDEKEKHALDTIYQRGIENGLKKIKRISATEIKEHEPHVNGIDGISVPYTGIINYKKVTEKYAEKVQFLGGSVFTNQKVKDIKKKGTVVEVITEKDIFQTKLVVNCGGLYSDKLAKLTNKSIDIQIIPFRGEYYELKKEKEYLVKNLIYPVPDPAFPFLGVHFTRMIGGGIEAGPNAVFAFKREGYKNTDFDLKELTESLLFPGFQKIAAKYWRTGLGEIYRSFSKTAFTRALQKLIPEIEQNDLVKGGAGVRAQACDRNGGLLDDFLILEDNCVINVCNAPSPAATSSLAIGNTVAEKVIAR
jgi:L-2-hydroxyglutarate oxidase